MSVNRSGIEWRPVVEFDHYEVSADGQVRSLDHMVRCSRGDGWRLWAGRPIKPTEVNKNGHLEVRLSQDGQVTRKLVHHLVLEAFVGSRPEGEQGLHWDDDPSNNCVGNLRWGTPPENGADAVRNGRDYHANKTHCPRNHEYSPENTFVTSQGGRACRTCKRERGRVAA